MHTTSSEIEYHGHGLNLLHDESGWRRDSQGFHGSIRLIEPGYFRLGRGGEGKIIGRITRRENVWRSTKKKNSKRGEGEKMSVPNTPRVAPRSDDFLELTGPPPPSIVGFSMRKIYPRMIDPRPSPPALSFTLYRLTLWPTDIELLLHLRPSRLSPSLRIPSRAL